MTDSARPLRLAVLYTVPFKSAAEDLAEDVVGAIQRASPGVEVAHHDVAKLRLYICPGCKPTKTRIPCRVNDVDSPLYKTDDQLIPLLDSVRDADMVLVVATVRAGGLNVTAQNLMERLDCAYNRTQLPPLKGKAAGLVLVTHQPNSWSVGDRVLGIMNCLGATIPAHAAVTVTSAGHPKTDEEESSSPDSDDDVTSKVASDLLDSRGVREMVDQLAEGLVKTAKQSVG